MTWSSRKSVDPLALAALVAALASACGGAPSVGTMIAPPPDPQAAARSALRTELEKERPASPSEFLSRWSPQPLAKLPYEPAQAVGIELLQASHLKLNASELEILGTQGLVISNRQQFPTFFYGYKAIYADDLPLYVSADSIMFAVHRSYAKILMHIERVALQPQLERLLEGMQQRLASTAGHAAESLADVDEYLAVALRLLGKPGQAVAGGRSGVIESLVAQIMAADLGDATLFGLPRTIDFSQFKPRGHYLDDSSLEKYFRAMMWLGRADTAMPLVQEQQGRVVFHRRPFAGALLLAELAAPDAAIWKVIDSTLGGFVGESDNMVVTDVPTLRTKAGAASNVDLLAKSDEELVAAIVGGGFGIQRIASQVLYVAPGGENNPLDRTFQMFGQRYIVDSEVLSNVVFDRVLPEGGMRRMMPTPLDVGFAALGNNAAAPLLAGELEAYKNYPGALHSARRLVDLHEPAFWDGSLYGAWMAALRALSPPPDGRVPAETGLPAIAGTDAWGRRILNTQLASWSELRHDTLLYAKQSYTGFPVCEFPDAYVEPSVAFWDALVRLAQRGTQLVAEISAGGPMDSVKTYFATLERTAGLLKGMAEHQRSGQPFTAEQMTFINQAVEMKEESVVCTTVRRPAGWYPELFFDRDNSTKLDPTIADVHTDPYGKRVLHVGTGYARLMVTTFETCKGPRAYVGLASSYFERTTENLQRLDDQAWSAELEKALPKDVPWLAPILGAAPARTACTSGQDHTCNDDPSISALHGRCLPDGTCACGVRDLNPATGKCR